MARSGGPDPTLVLILVGVIAVAGITYWRMQPETHPSPPPHPPTRAQAWLDIAKRGCKKGKVAGFLEGHPPPGESAAYAATCHAIGEDIASAKRVLDAVPEGERQAALHEFFGLTHRLADAGQELEMGPAMELVAQRWPKNYQAVYHSGMAAFKREDHALARPRLEQFLKMYKGKGAYYRTAKDALAKLPASPDAGALERPQPSALSSGNSP